MKKDFAADIKDLHHCIAWYDQAHQPRGRMRSSISPGLASYQPEVVYLSPRFRKGAFKKDSRNEQLRVGKSRKHGTIGLYPTSWNAFLGNYQTAVGDQVRQIRSELSFSLSGLWLPPRVSVWGNLSVGWGRRMAGVGSSRLLQAALEGDTHHAEFRYSNVCQQSKLSSSLETLFSYAETASSAHFRYYFR